jgi:lysyl-tRNA synthetase class 2
MDYPRELASLAKVDPKRPEVAERFELYLAGIELANGFSELTDTAEQRQRFEAEIAVICRTQGREQAMPERFLHGLEGLERAAGIALGLDRLLMLIAGKDKISEVVTFHPSDF